MPCCSAIGGLHLCETAVHEQFCSRDEAAVVGCEKHDGLRYLIGSAEPAERGVCREAGICEHDIELALVPLDLREQAIKIVELRHVAFYGGHIFSDLFYGRVEFLLTTSGYEDVCAFVHELFCGG